MEVSPLRDARLSCIVPTAHRGIMRPISESKNDRPVVACRGVIPVLALYICDKSIAIGSAQSRQVQAERGKSQRRNTQNGAGRPSIYVTTVYASTALQCYLRRYGKIYQLICRALRLSRTGLLTDAKNPNQAGFLSLPRKFHRNVRQVQPLTLTQITVDGPTSKLEKD